jgi:hypothetical protein
MTSGDGVTSMGGDAMIGQRIRLALAVLALGCQAPAPSPAGVDASADAGAIEAGADIVDASQDLLDAPDSSTSDEGVLEPDASTASDIIDVGTAVDVPADAADGSDGPDASTAARPVTPLASVSVASDRPRFAVALQGGAEGAVVELCRDRACSMSLARLSTVAGVATAAAALPRGTLYWRAVPTRGGEAVGAPSSVRALRVLARGRAATDSASAAGSDLDCDGYEDAVLPLSLGAPAGSSDYGLFPGSASGLSTRAVASVRVPTPPAGPVFADIDGDGCSEVFVGAAGWTGAALRAGRGPDLMLPAPAVDGHADVDGDGREDLILANGELRAGTGLTVGPAFRVEPGCLVGPTQATRFLGDLDGDGFADVALTDARGIEGVASGASDRVLRVGRCLAGGSYGAHTLATWGPGSIRRFGNASPDDRAAYVVSASGTTEKGDRFGPVWTISRADGWSWYSASVPLTIVGDHDGDGFADAMDRAGGGLFLGGIYAARGLSPLVTSVVALSVVQGLGDVDGDGFDDVLVDLPGGVGVVHGSATPATPLATRALDVRTVGPAQDGGVAPDASVDGGTDAGTAAPLRLVYPPTFTRVGEVRPIFRWRLASPATGAEVQVCSDAACASVVTSFRADGTEAAPPVDLPRRRVFWRARPINAGSPDGTFTVTRSLRVSPTAGGRDVGWAWSDTDVNGDGRSDVVHGGSLWSGTPTGPGDRTSFSGTLTSIGDVNGDGRSDLVAGEALYLGSDSGPVRAGVVPAGLLRAGDLDGDGMAETVSATTARGLWRIYPGGPTGPRADLSYAITLYTPAGGSPGSTIFWSEQAPFPVGDVNDDGYDDLAYVVTSDERNGILEVKLLYGGPSLARFGEARTMFSRGNVIPIADVNGDRRPDLYYNFDGYPGILHEYEASLTFGGGAPGSGPDAVAFPGFRQTPGTSPRFARGLGDVDGDGFADGSLTGRCVSLSRCPMAPFPFGDEWLVIAPGSSGGWRAPYQDASREFTGVGDVNGDGYADVVALEGTSLRIFLGSPAGVRTDPVGLLTP